MIGPTLLDRSPDMAIATTLIAPILILMMYMSLRLYRSRRRAAFFWLSLSLLLALVNRLLLHTLYAQPDQSATLIIAGHFSDVFAFLLLQLALYQLYNASRAKPYLVFAGALMPLVALAAVAVYLPVWAEGTPEQIRQLQDVGFQIYTFLILFLCYHHLPVRTSQPGLYRLSLFVYFVALLAGTLNTFVWDNGVRALQLASSYLPVAYYGLLFVFLFDRTVELLNSIYRSSITDGLTGLYNRSYMNRKMERLLSSEGTISVIFSDIDNFKKLNDSLGHDKGDEALKQVADIAREEALGCGFAGRYGGEEMVIVLTDAKTKPADWAERFRARVEQESGVTVSVGFAKSRGEMKADQLVKLADEAMYQAKTTGKNKVVGHSKRRGKGEQADSSSPLPS